MKKLILIMALLPLNVFAEEAHPDVLASNDNCSNLLSAVERNDCLNTAKKKEAKQNFKNFQESKQLAYPNQDF